MDGENGSGSAKRPPSSGEAAMAAGDLVSGEIKVAMLCAECEWMKV
jgi:hypothetical protein